MKMIDLFSGIGGFSLAGFWAGWETIVTCDVESFTQRVMKYYFPDAYHHGDIHTLNKEIILKNSKWNESETTIITGGFPCQPFSIAGKRKGTEDDRNLWPEMLRIIREIQPCWVVAENVLGLVSWSGGLVFEQVQVDLEDEGYETWSFVLPAAGVNAPHLRYRIWIVANSQFTRLERKNRERMEKTIQPSKCFTADNQYLRSSRKEHGQAESEKYSTNDKAVGWENFPAQSPICSRDDGFPGRLVDITFPKWRNKSIKALGNAIVPQVAYQIFKAINEYEKIYNKP